MSELTTVDIAAAAASTGLCGAAAVDTAGCRWTGAAIFTSATLTGLTTDVTGTEAVGSVGVTTCESARALISPAVSGRGNGIRAAGTSATGVDEAVGWAVFFDGRELSDRLRCPDGAEATEVAVSGIDRVAVGSVELPSVSVCEVAGVGFVDPGLRLVGPDAEREPEFAPPVLTTTPVAGCPDDVDAVLDVDPAGPADELAEVDDPDAATLLDAELGDECAADGAECEVDDAECELDDFDEVELEDEFDEPDCPVESADATPDPDATAAPIPNATASPPIRPTYAAAPMRI